MEDRSRKASMLIKGIPQGENRTGGGKKKQTNK